MKHSIKTTNDIEYTNHCIENFYNQDPEIFSCIENELSRQHHQIELIASENFVSTAVLAAMGSILTNKYAEGYCNARYYGGCENVDIVENLAITRLCKLFGSNFANVQPHSGASANLAAFYAFLKPGDSFLGMDLACGGHLTHGAKPTISGKWFNPIAYSVDKETNLINYNEIEELAIKHKPKLIIAGSSAYPRQIDFARFRKIADNIGAFLMVDMAHYAGLIATGIYPNPLPYADIVTSTTHKTLRGPRGGIILWNNPDHTKKINSAIFPGTQGGPLMHVIAAKAVAFKECLEPSFTTYTKNVLENAQVLAQSLKEEGLKIITGGTDCHLVLVNTFEKFNINGKTAEKILEHAGLTCNKNAVPFDILPVNQASGIRLGSAAATTRGFNKKDFHMIGKIIANLLSNTQVNLEGQFDFECQAINECKNQIHSMCKKLPNS